MKKLFFILLLAVSVSSCFVQRYDVGTGAQGNAKVKQMNAYLIGGLIPLSTAQPPLMAGNSENYTVINKRSFVDYLIAGITGGIFTPTTTIVRK